MSFSDWSKKKKKKEEESAPKSFDQWREEKYGIENTRHETTAFPSDSSSSKHGGGGGSFDDDIAPVKETEKKEKWYEGWFDKGAFDDGYQFGDVTKSLFATGTDLSENVMAGILGMGEKVVDAGAYVAGAVGGMFSDDFKKSTEDFIKKDLYDEKKVARAILKPQQFLSYSISDPEEDSLFGDKTDSLAQSGGELIGTVALQAAGVPWFVTTGTTSFGGEVENAFNQGATYGEAGASAAITAGAEILTEKLSGGISFGGNTLDDVLTKQLTTNISNKVVRTMAKLGMDVVGEGSEEVVSQVFSNLGSALYREESLSEILASEEAVNEYIESFIGGAVLGGTGSGFRVVNSMTTGRDATSGLTANEEKVFKQIYDERIAEEQDGKKLTAKEKAKIYDEVMQELEKGYISTDKIESVLGGEAYKSYQDTIESEESAIKELESLYEGEELTQAVNNILENSKRTELKNQLSKEVADLAVKGKDTYLSESYYEAERRKQKFEADLSKYDAKTQETIKKAVDSGILNNTTRTHEFVDMIAKISADKGVLFDFTNNEKLAESGFAVNGKSVNGYYANGGVTVNIDSEKSLNYIVGHEITHVLEGTEFYDALQETIFEYAKTKGVYESMLKDTYELYKNIDGYKGVDGFKAIKREVVSDLVGDYLFTDADFINNLSTTNRNVFQKIYDEIKYLYKIATAGSKEARELERVKHAFEQAYKGEGKANTDTKYSLSTVEAVKPTSQKWQRTYTTEEAKAIYPNMWNVAAEESEVRNPTQITSTVNSYRKIYDFLKNEGFNGTVLDASSGLGYGTKAGVEEYGFDVEDIEPYPDKNYKPKYTDYSTLNKKYDVIISNAVLNVLPQDQRDALAVKMGELLNDGGRMFINVRGKDVEQLAKTGKNIHLGNMEWIETVKGSYQKGFTKDELKAYLEDALGDGFTVEKSNMFGAVSVVVTKNGGVKYSLSDSDGKKLTKEQGEYFKDSKVRDENGNLKVMYHGTSKGGYTIFDTYGSQYGLFGQGSYFTDNKDVAEGYTKKGKGKNPQVYETYLNITNPMDMDAQANADEWKKAFPDATFPESGTNEDFYRAMEEYFTDEQYSKWDAAEEAMESIMGMGYDGITHIGGGRFNKADETRHQVYIAFNPEQIKNIDNVKPTDSADIRYSLSEDNEGTKLSKEQKDFFKDSKIVDENGRLKVMYHGTPNGDFSVFKDGTYFTDNKEYADRYQNPSASSIKAGKTASAPKTFEVYLDIKKPFDINDAEAREIYINDYIKGGNAMGINPYLSDAEYDKIKAIDWTEGEDLRDFLIENEYDYDGLILDEGADGGYGEDVKYRGKSYVVFSPEQIKSIDNKKPTTDKDIRYSLSKESDKAYLDAVNRGETATAQKMVDEAAKNAGYTIKAYHGTPNTEFTVFDKGRLGKGNDQYGAGFYFATDKEAATHYGKRVIDTALNIKNPIRITATADSGANLIDADVTLTQKQAYEVIKRLPNIYDAEESPLGDYYDSYWEEGAQDWMIRDLARQNRDVGYLDSDLFRYYPNELHEALRDIVGYDGVEVTFEKTGEKFYVAWFDNQMKSTDAVTYDDSGKVIPLSERFNADNNDIRYTLSENGKAPKAHGRYNVYGKDIRLEQDIAPVVETVETIGETVPQTENKVTYDLSPEPMTEEEANALQRENAESLTDEDAPPETEAPYYGEIEEIAPDDPFEKRDIDDVGNRKVKAYMYENPEVKPFFQNEANVMLGELRDTTKGERWYNDKLYYDTNGERGFFGTQRHTSNDIAYLLDELGYTYAEIEKGLNNIIEDNGKENNACSKRIEFLLNDRLLKGYQDMDGMEIPADEDYIRLLREKEIFEYSDEARKKFFGVADDYAPIYEQQELFEDKKPTENAAPVREGQKKLFDDTKTEKKPFRGKQQKLFGTPQEEKVAEVMVEEPKAPKKKNRTWEKAVGNLIDKGSVFETLSLKTKNRELQAKYNFMHYSENRAQSYINKHLKPIVEKVEKAGKTKQFYEYAYHLHNIDRMSLDTEENINRRAELRDQYFDGKTDKAIEKIANQWITKKTPKDEAERIKAAREYVDANMTKNKPVYGDSVTAEVSRKKVKELEAENPEFFELEQEILRYNTELRQMLVNNNVISQKTADLWANMYPHYVPIRRLSHEGAAINVPLDTRKTGVNAPIKRATGGNSDILPLFDTMAMRTEQTFKAIARNSFGTELMHTLDSVVEKNDASMDEIMDSINNQEELMKKDELLKKGENGKAPTFTVFENGKRVEFEITEEMYDALKPASEGLSTTLLSSKAVDAFKKVTTQYSPKFMVSNPIKDAQDVLINSQHPLKTYANMPKAFLELATHGRYYTEYMENGGEQNTYFDSETKTFKEASAVKKVLGLPLRGVSMANDFFERAPRLAEYMASRKKGASIETAMLDAARVTTNFSAGGDVTRFLGRNFVPFLNPSVQGAAQQVRNVREAASEGFTGVLKLAGRYAAASIPVLMFNALMWDDDEEYEELSDYVKENYYVVAKFGDGQFVRIPKGRTLSVIQSAVEQALNVINGKEADFASTGKLAITNLAPNNPLDNNILSTFMQIQNNETWYGEELVPSRLQDMPEAEQYDESIDLVSRWLGEKLNYSPYKINYLIDQYTGGIGDMLLPIITPETTGGEDSLADYAIAPWKDLFTTDSVMKNQNVSDFYETVDELTKSANSMYATDEDILASKYMNSINSELGELYKQKREIQSDTTIPKDRKYTLVRDIQAQIDNIAKESLNTYGKIDIDNGYATVGDLHYRTNKDGEWEKISDKQLEKQEEVTRGLGISASDYWSNKEEYDYAYDYPEKYAVAKAVGGYESYKTYSSELYDIHADKDENGKSISGSRKEKVIDYINNLDADYYEKIILFKSEYNADDTYNQEIIDYLNEREDISYREMEQILKELGFTVDSNGNISWD